MLFLICAHEQHPKVVIVVIVVVAVVAVVIALSTQGPYFVCWVLVHIVAPGLQSVATRAPCHADDWWGSGVSYRITPQSQSHSSFLSLGFLFWSVVGLLEELSLHVYFA